MTDRLSRAREYWIGLKGKWKGTKGTDMEFINAMAREFESFATSEAQAAVREREIQIADELHRMWMSAAEKSDDLLMDVHLFIDRLRKGEAK